MATKFTPLFMQDQREKAQAAKVEEVPYSWEFRTVGARELPNRAIYAADAANFYPAALDEIDRLRLEVAKLRHRAIAAETAHESADTLQEDVTRLVIVLSNLLAVGYHPQDCPGGEGCTCGLENVRKSARYAISLYERKEGGG